MASEFEVNDTLAKILLVGVRASKSTRVVVFLKGLSLRGWRMSDRGCSREGNPIEDQVKATDVANVPGK